MDRRIRELTARHEAAPDDASAALALAGALRRAGDRVRAFAVLDLFLERERDEEVHRLRGEILADPPGVPPIEPQKIHQFPEPIIDLHFDSSERTLAVAWREYGDMYREKPDRIVVLRLDAYGSVEQERVVTAERRACSRLALSRDGRCLAVYNYGHGTRVWDTHTGAKLLAVRAQNCDVQDLELVAGGLEIDSSGEVSRRVLGRKGVTTEPNPFPRLPFPGLSEEERKKAHRRVRKLLDEILPPPHGFAGVNDRRVLLGRDARSLSFYALAEDNRTHIVFHDRRRPRSLQLDGDRTTYMGTFFFLGRPPPFSLSSGGHAFAESNGHFHPNLLGVKPGGWIHLLGEEVRTLRFLDESCITALNFSPSGGRLAFGTREGEVYLLDLIPNRPVIESSETDAPAEVSTPLGLNNLLEHRGEVSAGGFVLLRALDGATIPLAGPRIVYESEVLWLIPNPKRAGGKLREFQSGQLIGERVFSRIRQLPVVKLGYRIDLSSAQELTLVRGEDDHLYRVQLHDFDGREAYGANTTVDLEPSGFQGPAPAYPEKPRKPKRPGAAKAIEAALGVKCRGWLPAPETGFLAVQAPRRGNEVWVVDPTRPRERTHLVCPAEIRQLAWSPGGTRLAVLLADGSLLIFGAAP